MTSHYMNYFDRREPKGPRLGSGLDQVAHWVETFGPRSGAAPASCALTALPKKDQDLLFSKSFSHLEYYRDKTGKPRIAEFVNDESLERAGVPPVDQHHLEMMLSDGYIRTEDRARALCYATQQAREEATLIYDLVYRMGIKKGTDEEKVVQRAKEAERAHYEEMADQYITDRTYLDMIKAYSKDAMIPHDAPGSEVKMSNLRQSSKRNPIHFAAPISPSSSKNETGASDGSAETRPFQLLDDDDIIELPPPRPVYRAPGPPSCFNIKSPVKTASPTKTASPAKTASPTTTTSPIGGSSTSSPSPRISSGRSRGSSFDTNNGLDDLDVDTDLGGAHVVPTSVLNPGPSGINPEHSVESVHVREPETTTVQLGSGLPDPNAWIPIFRDENGRLHTSDGTYLPDGVNPFSSSIGDTYSPAFPPVSAQQPFDPAYTQGFTPVHAQASDASFYDGSTVVSPAPPVLNPMLYNHNTPNQLNPSVPGYFGASFNPAVAQTMTPPSAVRTPKRPPFSPEVVVDFPRAKQQLYAGMICYDVPAYTGSPGRQQQLVPKYWTTRHGKEKYLRHKFADFKHADAKFPSRDLAKAGSQPLKIAIDLSNIIIGFYDKMKEQRGIPLQRRVAAPAFSFHRFEQLMARDRTIGEKVIVGSSKNEEWPDYMLEAESLGYEMNILRRVPKPFPPRASDNSGEEYSPAKRSVYGKKGATPRNGEQGVDEILHLRLLDWGAAIVRDEFPQPGTICLATGDAATAEFSQGFKKYVERLLEWGWRVELYGWSRNISSAWRETQFTKRWTNSFKIFELDPFVEELFDVTVESIMN
ncbi:hypothetical protein QBC35DRAFT_218977 [Podospora australis]|uniref:NYN domain-containing protein n=1 Tax=Podospora australis TaxID=1536484 RepID=A0AAN6WTG1_9PEZI|nr:hypothetical protein QBC35DRAFT_218977 [Podospora australis]